MIRYVRTRLAPTPSGLLHLGNVLSFSITEKRARETGARILLRIDDLDQLRTEPEFIQDIFDTLEFLGIPWQEGPRNPEEFRQHLSQVHRMDLYRQALADLKETGRLFACRCSRSDIARNSPDGGYPGTCRDLAIPLDASDTCWRLRTDATVPAMLRDFVVRKKDGYPAYQLTSVIDDLHFKVDLVVRGEDLRPSTMAQQYLATLLPPNDFAKITFHHHDLLLDPAGQKLSKTAGAVAIRTLRRRGVTPQEIYELIDSMRSAD